MKWKKVISGLLAGAMVMSTAISAVPQTAFAQNARAGEEAVPIKVSQMNYTKPEEGGQPQPATALIEKGYDAIADRSKNPAEMTSVNIALGKPVETSSNSEGAAGNIVDGMEGADTATIRWVPNGKENQWAVIDLEAESANVEMIRVASTHKAYAQEYEILTCDNKESEESAWEQVATVAREGTGQDYKNIVDTFVATPDPSKGGNVTATGQQKEYRLQKTE